MNIKICPRCQKPYMMSSELCPHCNEPFKWNKENMINIGYLLAFIIPLIIVLSLWAIFFSGLIFR